MKKFLRILVKHIISIPVFLILAIIALVYMNPAPIVIGIIVCVPLFAMEAMTGAGIKISLRLWGGSAKDR